MGIQENFEPDEEKSESHSGGAATPSVASQPDIRAEAASRASRQKVGGELVGGVKSEERVKTEAPPPPKPAPPATPPMAKPEKADKQKPEKKGKKEKGEKPPKEKKENEKTVKKEKSDIDAARIRRSEYSQSSLKTKSSVRFDMMLHRSKSAASEVESYSSSDEEEMLIREESRIRKAREKKTVQLHQEEKPKKEKGGKKGKGKKEKKDDQPEAFKLEEEPEPSDLFLANIFKMRAAAAAAKSAAAKAAPPPPASDVQTDESSEKKKKKAPKKALSKKEKLKMAALMEQMKKEAEIEAIKQAEYERIREAEEKKAAIEKEKREIHEQGSRLDQLEKTFMQIEEAKNCYKKLAKDEREILQWNLYIACGELPNPSIINKMSTYLHLWEQASERVTIDEASKRTADVIKLLTDVDDLLDSSPEEDVDATKIENWRWLRQLFRDLQRHNLDVVTYRLLRCVQSNLHRIDIPTADFDFSDANIKFSLWCKVQLPIPLPNPRRPPKSRLDVNIPNIDMQVLFPVSIDGDYTAVRAMYLNYDHLSDLSETYHMPEVSPQILQDIAESSKLEWRTKLQYKYAHSDIAQQKKAEEKRGERKEEKRDEGGEEEIPLVPYKKLQPTASEVAVVVEDMLYINNKKKITLDLPDHVLNLRKYTILGGIYHLNLVEQPPQPQDFVTMDLNITTLYLPKRLEYVPFYVPYAPPQPPEPGVVRTPEEIEEELKVHEAEMDKLMLVNMKWPTHVIFIELPLVYHWDENEKQWSKKDVYDLKHNEEKGTLSFRTGTFGIFGLATLKFTNLPFQAWELRPESDGSVTFQITAAIVLIEFHVKAGRVCISLLKNCPNTTLKNIVGVYFKLYKLKRILKETGVDIFPEHDSFCYIEGTCEKNWPMERHLYCNMAAISNCFMFTWSRWNLTAGRRAIVLQMREQLPEKIKQKPYSMLLVTPLKASFIECTEVSQVFCEDEIEGLKFNADLSNLLKTTTSITVRKKIQSASQEVVYVLSELLIATRVMSFS